MSTTSYRDEVGCSDHPLQSNVTIVNCNPGNPGEPIASAIPNSKFDRYFLDPRRTIGIAAIASRVPPLKTC